MEIVGVILPSPALHLNLKAPTQKRPELKVLDRRVKGLEGSLEVSEVGASKCRSQSSPAMIASTATPVPSLDVDLQNRMAGVHKTFGTPRQAPLPCVAAFGTTTASCNAK
jgi:hypothetical protein